MTRTFYSLFTSAAVITTLAYGCASSSNGTTDDTPDEDSGVAVDAGGKKLDGGKDTGITTKDTGVTEDPDTGVLINLDSGIGAIDTGILGSIDAGQKADAGPKDSGAPGTDAGLVCAPNNAAIATFTGGGYHAAGRVVGACNMTTLATACFSATATDTTCNNYLAANATCNACLITSSTSTKWGPLVDGALNLPGCLEIKSPGTPGALCANALQDNYDCQTVACDANCPIPASTSPGYNAAVTAFNTCVDNAIAGSCKTYTDKAFAANGKCIGVLEYADGGTSGLATNACFQQTTAGGAAESSDTYLTRFLGIFCGP